MGLVGKLVLLWLLGMNFFSWYYIILNLFLFKNLKEALNRWNQNLEKLKDLSTLIREVKKGEGDLISQNLRLFLAKFAEIYNFYREKEEGGPKELEERELEEQVYLIRERCGGQIGKGLGYLATTANTAPFIGLFGTVWGIMRAFHEIGLKGSASLATVAPGIAEALINTAMGLGVAIPASMAYNYFMLKRENSAKELEILYRKVLLIAKREFLNL